LDAELLLAHSLGTTQAGLLAWLAEPLPADAWARFEALVARRAAGEPVAYLVGRVGFMEVELEVSPAVLIPRPETELVVEWATGWARRLPAAAVVLDVGTGSGAIAVVLARRLPGAEVHATDLSLPALALARRNAERLAAPGIAFHQADLFPGWPERFDLVVANLPYVGTRDLDEVDPAVIAYEPAAALLAGPDGLDEIRRLLPRLPDRLAPGGAAALEIGWRQGPAVVALARAAFPNAAVHLHADLAGLDRWVSIETAPAA
jgi:release factor glutamine methyltransferase